MNGRKRKSKKVRSTASVRGSISHHRDISQGLDEIAEQKEVSLAWVVREAVEIYIADKWPLFCRMQGGS